MPEVKITDADIRAANALMKDLVDAKYGRSRAAGDFERSVLDEATALSEFAQGRDCRTYCIVVVSFLEDIFKRNFVERMNIDDAKKQAEFFGGNGPLCTFAQRVTIATGLGWIPSSFRRRADLLRKIRNEFAHNHNVHSLATDPALSWANELPPTETVWIDDERPNYRDGYASAPLADKLRLRVFTNAMHLAAQTLARARIMANELPPDYREEGFFGLTELEQGMIDIMIRHCFASVGLDAAGNRLD